MLGIASIVYLWQTILKVIEYRSTIPEQILSYKHYTISVQELFVLEWVSGVNLSLTFIPTPLFPSEVKSVGGCVNWLPSGDINGGQICWRLLSQAK
jgi:hypothetical protein